MNHINFSQECDNILKINNENKYNYNHPFFDNIKREFYFFINLNIRDNIVEGNLQCRKCLSKKIISQTKQTRSADEGETLFAICSNCDNKWTVRG